MHGEPTLSEDKKDTAGGLPAFLPRANGRRSISMTAARPHTAVAAAASARANGHRREPSTTNTIGALSSSNSHYNYNYSQSVRTTPSKRSNKLRRRQSAHDSSSASISASASVSNSGHGTNTPSPPTSTSLSYQVELGNALIAASHAESSRGTHPDLLQILNHERRPWGFSYARYPHPVRVWYGDRDEKIAENAVRWMERNMGPDRCVVDVVPGADHGLMYKSSVVVGVLEHVRETWCGREARRA